MLDTQTHATVVQMHECLHIEHKKIFLYIYTHLTK